MKRPDVPTIYGNLLTAYPGYQTAFQSIVRALLARGGVYVPEAIELGKQDEYRRVPFEPNNLEKWSIEWGGRSNSPGWTLVRNNPVQVSIRLSRYLLDFESIGSYVQRDHFESAEKIEEFLSLNREFYSLIHPSYGFIRISEMVRTFSGPAGMMRVGIDLKRAIPDLYWANFLGPEYVEMFGRERVLSTPCHTCSMLADGGALLILTASPLDYFDDPIGFDRLREKAKIHLGMEAFDTGDISRRGKTPEFRFLGKNKRGIEQTNTKQRGSNSLSQVGASEWQRWLKDQKELATGFVREIPNEFGLDFSPDSLARLDLYVQRLRQSHTNLRQDFVLKVAAYVSQVLINETKADWSFVAPDDIPYLRLDGVRFSPLDRAHKAVFDGETFEHWHRLLVLELLPKSRLNSPTRE